MPQCPNCRAEHSPDSRFCAECGARLDLPAAPGLKHPEERREGMPEGQPTAPARGLAGPAQPTGKETIVLRIPDLAPTERLPNQPSTDGTVAASPAGPAIPPAMGKTIVAGQPGLHAETSRTPGSAASTPTSALPAAALGSQPAGAPTLPPAAVPTRTSGGSRFWLVIGLVVLLGLGLVGALIGGVLLITREAGTPPRSSTPEAGGGLARLPTSAPRPTATARPTATTRPTAAPEPTAAPTNFSTVLLEDDFGNPRRSSLTENTTDNATYSFVDGAYAIHLKTPKYIVWSPLDGTYADAMIEVDTTLGSGPPESAVGVIFRYQDVDNFYLFSVSGSGSYSLDLYKQNERQALIDWTDAPSIKGQGKPNRLRVETVGDRIRLFVNDTLLDEVTDDTFGKGELALAVNTFSEGDTIFMFDNLIVRGRK